MPVRDLTRRAFAGIIRTDKEDGMTKVEFDIEVPCSEEQAEVFVDILDNYGGDFDAMKDEFPDASDEDVETVSYAPSFEYRVVKDALSVWSRDRNGNFEMAVMLIHLWMRRENIPGAVPAVMHYSDDEGNYKEGACVISKGGIAWCKTESLEDKAKALAEKIAAEQAGNTPKA